MRCGRCAEPITDGRVHMLTLLHIVGAIDEKPIGESVQLTLHADCCAEIKGFYRADTRRRRAQAERVGDEDQSQGGNPTTLIQVIGVPVGEGPRKN